MTAASSSAENGSVSQLLQRDDRIAIIEVITRHRGVIVKLVYEALDPRFERIEDADDRLQEALLKVWLAATAGRFKEIPNRHRLIGWLRTVVLNNARDSYDKIHAQKREVNRLQGESALASLNAMASSQVGIGGVPDALPEPDVQAMERDQMNLVEVRLDDDERQLLHLIMESLSVKEIAKELDVVPATVRNRRRKLRAKLRRLAEEQAGE